MAGIAIRGELVSSNRVGRPLKFKNRKELKIKIDAYFEQVSALRDLPTITELAVYLETDRKTLYNYQSNEEFFPAIKEAMAKCEAALEKRALLGGLNATMAIFSLKNNYGWIDRVDTDVTSGGEKIGEVSASQTEQLLRARALRSSADI